ncbi:DUF2288 domain-containing protein [Kovacikia minuta CCNUW1]|uniref:DUF2288 domain-containing protein n=1 Tax=Kovacikia minuta TaxID=2931930 RepID=UPI001CC9A8A1|nr:DUF2288 domain-containing protein [Kovacikia minuta]UBF29155.1 DUF2288 domain-containing protein [Kovacikia minuta CCNUW1]
MSDLRAELAESIDEAEWNWLAPHARRDSVIVVKPELELPDVAVAIANDNVALVQRWIEQDLIHKPYPTQLSDWNGELTKRFRALIVQPYVLIQETN